MTENNEGRERPGDETRPETQENTRPMPTEPASPPEPASSPEPPLGEGRPPGAEATVELEQDTPIEPGAPFAEDAPTVRMPGNSHDEQSHAGHPETSSTQATRVVPPGPRIPVVPAVPAGAAGAGEAVVPPGPASAGGAVPPRTPGGGGPVPPGAPVPPSGGRKEPSFSQAAPSALHQGAGARGSLRALIALMAVGAVLLLAGGAAVGTGVLAAYREDRTSAPLPEGIERIVVDAPSTDIDLDADAAGRAQATLTSRSLGEESVAEMNLSQDGSTLTIDVEGSDAQLGDARLFNRTLSLSLPLSDSAGMDLEVSGSGRHLSVSGGDFGAVTVTQESGWISFSDGVAESMSLRVDDGSIDLAGFGVRGSLDAFSRSSMTVDLGTEVLPTGPVRLESWRDVNLGLPDFGDPSIYAIDAEVEPERFVNLLPEPADGSQEPAEDSAVDIAIIAGDAYVNYSGERFWQSYGSGGDAGEDGSAPDGWDPDSEGWNVPTPEEDAFDGEDTGAGYRWTAEDQAVVDAGLPAGDDPAAP